MQNQQGRKQVSISVPKDVAVVAGRTQSHGRSADIESGARAAEQIKKHGVDDALQLIISLDDDIGLPQVLPCFFAVGEQSVPPLSACSERSSFGFFWIGLGGSPQCCVFSK